MPSKKSSELIPIKSDVLSNSKTKILVITSSIDLTVSYIMEKYPDIDFFRLNVDEFPIYEIAINGNGLGWEIKNKKSEQKITLYETKSIYYRKPMLPDVSEYEECYQDMISKDIIGVVIGIADSFEGMVLSPPSLLKKAENKTNQLLYAFKNGIKMPFSFIGNSNKKKEIFYNFKSIIKPLSIGKISNGDYYEIFHTSIVKENECDISLTPIYLQQYIKKNYEVRLTVVNDNFFAVRIDSPDKVDWRKNYNLLKYSLIKVPPTIKEKCKMMLFHYGLKFGAFDFIVDSNDDWIFLEVNPNGQWLWLEKELNLNISEKIIHLLNKEVV